MRQTLRRRFSKCTRGLKPVIEYDSLRSPPDGRKPNAASEVMVREQRGVKEKNEKDIYYTNQNSDV